MELHRNAKLGLAGRRALVEDVCVWVVSAGGGAAWRVCDDRE